MALNGHEVVPYLAVDGTEGTAQPDPNASLGGNRSGTAIYNLQSTLTSTQTTGRVFIDTSQISAGADVHLDKWVVFMTGPAAVHAAPVTAFDEATGTFIIRDATPSLAQAGNVYRLHEAGEFWDAITAQESADGLTHHRLMYLHNETGVLLNAKRLYFRFLDVGRCDFFVAASDERLDLQGITLLGNETEEPDLTELLDVSTAFTVQEFLRPLQDGAYMEVPPAGDRRLENSAASPIWLKRVLPPVTRRRDRVVLQLIHEFSNTGGSPDPLVTSMVIIFDLTGFTPVSTLRRDRALRIGGGARYELSVVTQESGAPVPGEDVHFSQTAGPGTLVEPTDPQTDSAGEIFASYTAPTNPVNEGDTVTVQAEV